MGVRDRSRDRSRSRDRDRRRRDKKEEKKEKKRETTEERQERQERREKEAAAREEEERRKEEERKKEEEERSRLTSRELRELDREKARLKRKQDREDERRKRYGIPKKSRSRSRDKDKPSLHEAIPNPGHGQLTLYQAQQAGKLVIAGDALGVHASLKAAQEAIRKSDTLRDDYKNNTRKEILKCDDCGQEKPRAEFSNNQIFGHKLSGDLKFDPNRMIKCKDCTDKRMYQMHAQHRAERDARKPTEEQRMASELYCKICDVELGSLTQHAEHMSGFRHRKNIQWYQSNPNAAIAAGLQDHPELKLEQIVGPMTAAIEDKPKAATAKAITAGPVKGGQLVVASAAKPKAQQQPSAAAIIVVPAPPLTQAQIAAEIAAEESAAHDLDLCLKRLGWPTGLHGPDSPVFVYFEEEGLEPEVKVRCFADFMGKSLTDDEDDLEFELPCLAVASQGRDTKALALRQAYLAVLRGILDWFETPEIVMPTLPQNAQVVPSLPQTGGMVVPSGPQTVSPPQAGRGSATPQPMRVAPPARGMPGMAGPGGMGMGMGMGGMATHAATFVQIVCPSCKSQVELGSIPQGMYECPMCDANFPAAENIKVTRR
eukprot:Hpha_TRINITY_DN15705_c2_g8::TRINITY_DN15705_c2_g8_i1::g.42089::m.42089